MPYGCYELNPDPVQEHPVLLNFELYFQPQEHIRFDFSCQLLRHGSRSEQKDCINKMSNHHMNNSRSKHTKLSTPQPSL